MRATAPPSTAVIYCRVPTHLHEALQQLARDEGRSMAALLNDILERSLGEVRSLGEAKRVTRVEDLSDEQLVDQLLLSWDSKPGQQIQMPMYRAAYARNRRLLFDRLKKYRGET